MSDGGLYEDMRRLNTLYEELMWDYDDVLEFTIENENIYQAIISSELKPYLEDHQVFDHIIFHPQRDLLERQVVPDQC